MKAKHSNKGSSKDSQGSDTPDNLQLTHAEATILESLIASIQQRQKKDTTQGKRFHAVIMEYGETDQQAIERFKQGHDVDRGDMFVLVKYFADPSLKGLVPLSEVLKQAKVEAERLKHAPASALDILEDLGVSLHPEPGPHPLQLGAVYPSREARKQEAETEGERPHMTHIVCGLVDNNREIIKRYGDRKGRILSFQRVHKPGKWGWMH